VRGVTRPPAVPRVGSGGWAQAEPDLWIPVPWARRSFCAPSAPPRAFFFPSFLCLPALVPWAAAPVAHPSIRRWAQVQLHSWFLLFIAEIKHSLTDERNSTASDIRTRNIHNIKHQVNYVKNVSQCQNIDAIFRYKNCMLELCRSTAVLRDRCPTIVQNFDGGFSICYHRLCNNPYIFIASVIQ
jgi:hypothetical protein